MAHISSLINDFVKYIDLTYQDIVNGKMSVNAFLDRKDTIIDVLESVENSIPQSIYNNYKEYIDSLIVFLNKCKDTDFLLENMGTLTSSLDLLSEVLLELSRNCESRIKRCACCGNQVMYMPFEDNELSKYIIDNKVELETLNFEEHFCSNCWCSDRDRLITLFLKKTRLEYAPDNTKVLQIAPSKGIHDWISLNAGQVSYDTTDLYMDEVSFKSDVQEFKEVLDKTYDVIICSHVLEHVQNDRKAISSLKRILKDDGFVIFLVPVNLNQAGIDEQWGCSPEENLKRFGQTDHCRTYSKQGLIDRLSEEFFVHELGIDYFGAMEFINNGITEQSILYVLTKKKNAEFDLCFKPEVDMELCENGPLVSVIMSSYNHEPYVAEAIESVINQTYKNIEFIVADDGSSDGTVDVMKKYSKYFKKEMYFEDNKGGRYRELKNCVNGKYVALMNSDDIWDYNKIAIQVKYMEDHPECGTCFTWCHFVDEDKNIIDDRLFIQKNRSRAEWLRLFWDEGNCLCHPSTLARREVYSDIEHIGASGRQIPDLFKWIDLVQKTDIYVFPYVLTYMRTFSNSKRENTSTCSDINVFRTAVELGLGWFWNIRNMDKNLFIETFNDIFINKDASTDSEIKLEKFFLLKNSEKIFVQTGALYYFTEEYSDLYDVLPNEYTSKTFWDDLVLLGTSNSIYNDMKKGN